MTDPGGGEVGGSPFKLYFWPRFLLVFIQCITQCDAETERTEMFKTIRKATNKVEWMWFWLTRYMVVARGRVHWAKTEAEALEWMACYPADALMMYGKRGKLIGARHM